MQQHGNIYSKFWYETFLHTIDDSQTKKEVDFIKKFLPLPKFNQILDCACGPGRHACYLVSSGYSVTGIDTDLNSISIAKKSCKEGTFLQLDMRKINELEHNYDAVIIMWQSFGYFSTDENRSILHQMDEILNSYGRIILDIYNRQFYDKYQGTREFIRNNADIKGSQILKGNRLYVELDYGSKSEKDKFEWEIFYDYEITEIMKEHGFSLLLKCTQFDKTIAPHEDSPRMQLVFEKF